jgi:hypothetical protein
MNGLGVVEAPGQRLVANVTAFGLGTCPGGWGVHLLWFLGEEWVSEVSGSDDLGLNQKPEGARVSDFPNPQPTAIEQAVGVELNDDFAWGGHLTLVLGVDFRVLRDATSGDDLVALGTGCQSAVAFVWAKAFDVPRRDPDHPAFNVNGVDSFEGWELGFGLETEGFADFVMLQAREAHSKLLLVRTLVNMVVANHKYNTKWLSGQATIKT